MKQQATRFAFQIHYLLFVFGTLGLIAEVDARDAPLARRAATPTFVVNSHDDLDDGACDARHCSLREAVGAANATRRGAAIHFALLGGYHRIVLSAALPPLRGRIVLDGSTQSGSKCPIPVVQIDGAALRDSAVNGLELYGRGNIVRGLVISNFGAHGIVVKGDYNRLQCLFVGTDASGTAGAGNAGHGVAIAGGHSNHVGGTAPEHANLLSANQGWGLYVENALNTYRHNNGIGLDIYGKPKLPNTDATLPLINPPPLSPRIAKPRALRSVTAQLERYVARITGKQTGALEDSSLYKKFARLKIFGRRGDAPVPKDLGDLIAALAAHPEYYADFARQAEVVLGAAREKAAADTAQLTRMGRRLVPSFGLDAVELPEDQRDTLGEILATFARDDYVVTGPPSDLVAALDTGHEITLPPLLWHSLETYGPPSFSTKLSEIPVIRTCVGLGPCFWPVAYDLLPEYAQLLWESSALSEQDIKDIVQERDFFMELRVNGQLLHKGPPPGSVGVAPLVEQLQGYYAASIPGAPCPAGKQCLATNVLVRKILRNVPKPWTFELKVWRLTTLDAPQIVGVDPNGKLIVASEDLEIISQFSRVVQANPETGSAQWFTQALLPTFHHPRCADCHGFGNFDGLAAHHGYSNTQDFVSATSARLEPSAYVPGAHVINCSSCHVVPLQDNHGHPFHEIEWIAPYFDLDVNWGQKNSAQICSRVKTNLPTKELRHEHFHGDGRLFWAVEYPNVPGQLLPKAPPGNFDEFLRRVDLWNIFGSPCP